jgi:hypothetical protein
MIKAPCYTDIFRARAKITCTFFGRDGPVCCVAPPQNIPNIPRRRALHPGPSRSEIRTSYFDAGP